MEVKQTKSVLLAAPVTPDFIERFDRSAKSALPGAETRSAAVRYVIEQWIRSTEASAAALTNVA